MAGADDNVRRRSVDLAWAGLIPCQCATLVTYPPPIAEFRAFDAGKDLVVAFMAPGNAVSREGDDRRPTALDNTARRGAATAEASFMEEPAAIGAPTVQRWTISRTDVDHRSERD